MTPSPDRSPHAALPGGPVRFHFVDALRGIACSAVVLNHLAYDLTAFGVLGRVPWAVAPVLAFGRLGVQVFFVISGFVIAHSVRDFDGGVRSGLWFAVRRQVRLDPPYYVAILATLAASRLQGVSDNGMPGWAVGPPDLVANLTYTNYLLVRHQVLSVGWTLCIEVQLYLLFIALLTVTKRAGGRHRWSLPAACCMAGGIASVLMTRQVPLSRWAVPYWHFFAGGTLLYLALRKLASPWWLVGLSAAVVARLCRGANVDVATGWGTIAVLAGVGLAGRLGTWTLGPAVQYLGRISYSLYLVHRTVLILVLWPAGQRLPHASAAVATGLSASCLALSLVAAHLLWRGVEYPAMRIAHRLHTRPPPATAVAPGA